MLNNYKVPYKQETNFMSFYKFCHEQESKPAPKHKLRVGRAHNLPNLLVVAAKLDKHDNKKHGDAGSVQPGAAMFLREKNDLMRLFFFFPFL